MRTLEKALIILSAGGIIVNELLMPGGSILLVFGLTVLGVLYFIFSWLLFRDRETKTYKLSLAAPAGIVLAIACAGIMFKLMLWPGSEIFLPFASITLATISGAAFYLQRKNEDPALGRFYRNVMQRLVPFFFMVFALILISDNALIKLRYREDPELARLIIRVRENPGNQQYEQELNDYIINKADPSNQ